MRSSRVFVLLITCIAFAVISAEAQQVSVDHFLGSPGIGSRDGQGADARFNQPTGLWVEGDSLYVVDSGNSTIRKVSLGGGVVTTIAGALQSAGEVDGVGSAAKFRNIQSVWGNSQSLYIAEGAGLSPPASIRRLDLATAEVRTVATLGSSFGMSVAGNSGHLYTWNYPCFSVWCGPEVTITATDLLSGASQNAAEFKSGITQPPSTFWADDQFLNFVFISAGTLMLQKFDLGSSQLLPAEPIGSAPASVSSISYLWPNGAGHVFISDRHSIYDLDTVHATVSIIATPGMTLNGLTGVGNTLFASTASSIIQINIQTAQVTTLAGVMASNTTEGAIWGDGEFLYVGTSDGIEKISLNSRQSSMLSSEIKAFGLWGDGKYLYAYAGGSQSTLNRVDPATGENTVLMTGLTTSFPAVMAGDSQFLYVVDSISSTTFVRQISLSIEPSASGVPTPPQRAFSDGVRHPGGLWSDGVNLFVAQGCGIRKFKLPLNESTLLAGQDSCPQNATAIDGFPPNVTFVGLGALWSNGSLLYVVDGSTIRTIDPATGETHTIAGNPKIQGTEDGSGTDARFNSPGSLWGISNTLYVAEGSSNIQGGAIRRVIFPATFTLDRDGSESLKTDFTPDPVRTGSALLQTTTSGSLPQGAEIFSYRNNGVLVSEAAVPAVTPILSGRIYAETSSAVRTGIALANPSGSLVTVNFYFTSADGTNFGAGSFTLPGNGQLAAFLDEPPFLGSANATTFTFTSTSPVGAVALRGLVNERSDFLMTTLPVAPVPSTSSSAILIPQLADGGGWQTELLLVNPTDDVITGTAQLVDTYNYSIAPRSSASFVTPGTSTTIQTGAIRITPAANSKAPVASTVFSFIQNGVTVTESGVSNVETGTAFRVFAESNSSSLRTGVAIVNNTSVPAHLQYELLDSLGNSIGQFGSLTLAPNDHLSKFVDELPGMANLPASLEGVLRLTSDQSIAVIGLRGQTNERGEFLIATTPAIVDGSNPSGPLMFPHLVTGGGYTTEFLLLSNGSSSNGTILFDTQAGDSFKMPLSSY